MGYCGFVREAMKEKADIFWPEGNCMFAHYTPEGCRMIAGEVVRFLDRLISCKGDGVAEATV